LLIVVLRSTLRHKTRKEALRGNLEVSVKINIYIHLNRLSFVFVFLRLPTFVASALILFAVFTTSLVLQICLRQATFILFYLNSELGVILLN